MNSLTSAFYDVMYQYQLPFSPEGVEANLNVWNENKAPLLELLRRHPNWNEQELAVVFDFSEGRGIDHNSVDENKFEMLMLAQEAGLSDGDLSDFQAALNAATADYATVPDVSWLETIRARGRIKCAGGQKASRIINRLCVKFGLDQYQVQRIQGEHSDNPTSVSVKPYNSVFARLADSLNPIQIPKTGILSVHPCDFLEMSSKKNTWHSCHRLNGGVYCAGCQSYMGDDVSMIFFTVDDDIKADFYRAPRLTRQIFCYKNGMLLQSRIYPQNDGETQKLYRGIVQGAITHCLGVPNLWNVKTSPNEFKSFLKTREDSLHYPDYTNDYGTVSLLNGTPLEENLTIGSRSLCTCCGRPHDTLKCRACEPVVVCKECGKGVSQPTAHYMNEAYYCGECALRCGACGTWVHSAETHCVTGRNGITLHLCERCYESVTGSCEQCGSHVICQLVGGSRFCARVDYVAADAA